MRELFARVQSLARIFDIRLSLFDYSRGLLGARYAEHCNIVFGHHYLLDAHIVKALSLAEPADIFIGIAYLAAAVHNEPHFKISAELRLVYPFLDDMRNTPAVGRYDKNKALIGSYFRDIPSLYSLVHVEQTVSERICNMTGNISAVSRSGKI